MPTPNETTRRPFGTANKRAPMTSEQIFANQGRIPPQATDLEEVVLGALMLEKDAVNQVIDILSPDSFYLDKHQKIFAAIKTLFGKSDPIDILTVTNALKLSGELEMVGGAYYISKLTNRVVSSANIEYHARIIMQKHIQRQLIEISSQMIQEAFEDTTDVLDLLDKAENNLFQISENNLRRSYDTMQDLVGKAIKEIQNAKDADQKLRGVPSGYTALDQITQGWQKSDLIILAARPSMGKTAFALNLARNAAVQFHRPIAFFSLEMSSVQLVTRLISTETSLTADKLRSGDLAEHEWTQLNTLVSPLTEAPIYIDDTAQLSIFELRAKCRRLHQQYGIQMIFIDYLQLMTTKGDNRGNREQEISTISRSLKSLAKELQVPVLALSQLSRSVEQRPGSKKPILSDLRESGAIEQDADMVMFIYRPEYYKNNDETQDKPKGYTIIDIAKHRNGKLGEVELKFVGQYARFEELDQGFSNEYNTINPNDRFENSVVVESKMNTNIHHYPSDEDIPY